jgi:hypothetical protein
MVRGGWPCQCRRMRLGCLAGCAGKGGHAGAQSWAAPSPRTRMIQAGMAAALVAVFSKLIRPPCQLTGSSTSGTSITRRRRCRWHEARGVRPCWRVSALSGAPLPSASSSDGKNKLLWVAGNVTQHGITVRTKAVSLVKQECQSRWPWGRNARGRQ